MAIDVTRLLRTALADLETEHERIGRQIVAIRHAMNTSAGDRRARKPTNGRRARKPMSAAARQALSRRMKASWAKRRRTNKHAATRSK